MKELTIAEVLAQLPMQPSALTSELVSGVAEHRAELDALIASHSRGWRIERMPAIDRALLRLGTFELLHRPGVPTGPIISEAVELAAEYSTEESRRFVNGMLSRIAEVVRQPATPAVPASEAASGAGPGAGPGAGG